MKFLTNKSIIQKIVISILFVILFSFVVPVRVEAGFWDLGFDLLKEVSHLIAGIGDVVVRSNESFYVRDNSINWIVNAITG
mgnify:CR=1 FL=1